MNSFPPRVATAEPRSRRWRPSLAQQIALGLGAGALLGWLKPEWAAHTGWLRDVFLNLIKSLIAPLIFTSLVVGIAQSGDLRKVGRLGLKTFLYFEAATTLALAVGLAVVNLVRPGAGMALPPSASAVNALNLATPASLGETLVHVFPASAADAAARGDVLQIVAFSVLFALAVVAAGPAAEPVVTLCAAGSRTMFKFTDLVIRLAPVGAGAAVAVTVSQQGLGVLLKLGGLVLSLYGALAVFLVLLLTAARLWVPFSVRAFLREVRAPFLIAFTTASSEPALPKALEATQRLGVPDSIASFVIPAGYSFNLDGSTLYLALASVFVAQAAETAGAPHFGLGRQLALMLTLMIASKGVAAVPRASLVVLFAAAHAFGLPAEGVALILGVDVLMDMARTSVNIVGNCLAAVILAHWEGELGPAAAQSSAGET